jgi:hypothetical protein
MVHEVLRDPRFDAEFLALPSPARDACWHVLSALRRRPFAPGVGFRVERLRRITKADVWVAHFCRNRYRLLYAVDGSTLVVFGVGERPGFYRRLDRLRTGRRPSERSE